ncbi:sensor histidine kinase [Pararhodospirillum photometricum]|uniref:histidine kinase n=1 Tax=Pararhodospirillum photometricum DSM 122 TaxID=1150469 RepID=H6SPQ5_PARPM|nr:ATP-binding protein [Pararhodospirillum photometricum]CCG07175.1 Sensor protein [Pararhodospirillum photometricum DSM 122]
MNSVHAISNPLDWYGSLQRAYMAGRNEAVLDEASDIGRLMAIARQPLESLLDLHSVVLAEGIAHCPEEAGALVAAADVCLAHAIVGWRLAYDGVPSASADVVPEASLIVFLHFEHGGRLTPIQQTKGNETLRVPPWMQARDLQSFVVDLCGPHRLDDVLQAVAQRRMMAFDLTAGALGQRQYRALLCPFHDGSGILGLQDVTAQHLARNADFQRRKLESLGQLAGGIAHEINNLLQPIVTLTQMTLDDHADDKEMSGDLGVVLDCARRAADVVRDILAFARRSAPALTPLPLVDTLRHELVDLMETLPASVRVVETHDTAGPLAIHGNRPELGQILRNLIKNAVDAIDGQGTITISADLFDLAEAEAFLVALPAGRYARVSIADDGPGIDPPLLHRIFDPFFTTKDIGKGTGLGLAIVRSIIQSWGGGIVARNGETGAVFDLFLRLAPLPSVEQGEFSDPPCWDGLWQSPQEE